MFTFFHSLTWCIASPSPTHLPSPPSPSSPCPCWVGCLHSPGASGLPIVTGHWCFNILMGKVFVNMWNATLPFWGNGVHDDLWFWCTVNCDCLLKGGWSSYAKLLICFAQPCGAFCFLTATAIEREAIIFKSVMLPEQEQIDMLHDRNNKSLHLGILQCALYVSSTNNAQCIGIGSIYSEYQSKRKSMNVVLGVHCKARGIYTATSDDWLSDNFQTYSCPAVVNELFTRHLYNSRRVLGG